MEKYSHLRDKNRNSLLDNLPLKLPYSMNIEPTNKCNFRCLACPLSFDDYRDIVGYTGDIDFELYKKLIIEISKMGKLKCLRFYMEGEPLLNKRIIEMLKLAKEYDVTERIEFTTNASLLNEKIAQELIDTKIDYLRVSIYSVNQKRHERVTNSKVDIEKIYNNIKTVKELRDKAGAKYPFIYVKMLDSFDEKENQDFRDKYSAIADEVMIEKPMNWNDYEDRDLIGAFYGDKKINKENLFENKKEVCPFPFYSCIVNCDGLVTVCCVDWNKKTIVGDLNKNTFEEIWNGKEFNEFREMHIKREKFNNPSCKNCTFLYTSVDNLDKMTLEEFEEKYNN